MTPLPYLLTLFIVLDIRFEIVPLPPVVFSSLHGYLFIVHLLCVQVAAGSTWWCGRILMDPSVSQVLKQ